MQEANKINRPSTRFMEKEKTEELKGQRRQIEGYINILGDRVEALAVSCQRLQKLGGEVYTQNFLEFQGLTSETLAFLIIIERRLEKLPRTDKNDLHGKFDDLVVAIWAIVMRGSLTFLSIVSGDEHLPLGSRELFVRELRTLNDAQVRLSEERYKARLGKEIQKEMETAERILYEVIDKAPRLLSF